jgi:glycosyltransferase involved in cell wall biosynthesis
MDKKKIKVFLGAYVNYTNAQNLNCLALTKYLDSSKFTIYALSTYLSPKVKNKANLFHCFYPLRISTALGFFWGILHCDVAFLPKHSDTPLWVLKLARLLNKPIFTTIEGIDTIQMLITFYNSKDRVLSRFKYFNKIYPITDHIMNLNKDIRLENNLLLLGVDSLSFSFNHKERLSSIVFVGSFTKRKRVEEVLKLAANYPTIKFNIIGEGPEKNKLESNTTINTEFFGILNHNEINTIFKKSDLLFLPSKSEGFPKVILEAASAGVPSILYDSYGASAWIDNRKNGFVVSSFNQVEELVNELLKNSALLQEASKNTLELAHRFDWKKIINDWEKVIEDLYNGK